MNEIRIITASALILFGAVAALVNLRSVAVSMRNRKQGMNRHQSVVPLLSLITAVAAYFLYPIEHRIWVFIVPALDPGNWVLAVGLPVAIVRRSLRGQEKE
jgi:hypothetical protein